MSEVKRAKYVRKKPQDRTKDKTPRKPWPLSVKWLLENKPIYMRAWR